MVEATGSFAVLSSLFLIVLVSGTDIEYKVEGELSNVLSSAVTETELDRFLSKRSDTTPPSNFKNGSIEVDDHDYYSSKYLTEENDFQQHWLDLPAIYGKNKEVEISPLSNRTLVVRLYELKFSFPYYGHLLDYIGVGTNGFLYTGTLRHSRIADVQYIAPLQANFDVTVNSNSKVYIFSTDKQFTVQWDNVYNLDHLQSGAFTFQVSLFPNGTIHFVYKQIPLPISSLNSANHPLRVGISDAFFLVRYVVRGILYGIIAEYHSVDLLMKNITSHSTIILTPLPNCISANSCLDCSNVAKASPFDCGWCPSLNRCSDGVDRHRQLWTQSKCSIDAHLNCEVQVENPSTINASQGSMSAGSIAGITVGIIVAAILLSILVFISVLGIVCLYGFRHPTSRIGMYMIEHHALKRKQGESASYDVSKSKLEEYEES